MPLTQRGHNLNTMVETFATCWCHKEDLSNNFIDIQQKPIKRHNFTLNPVANIAYFAHGRHKNKKA